MTTPADDLRAAQALSVLRVWGETRRRWRDGKASSVEYMAAQTSVDDVADSLAAAADKARAALYDRAESAERRAMKPAADTPTTSSIAPTLDANTPRTSR